MRTPLLLMVLFMSAPLVHGADVFHSPDDDGVSNAVAAIPENGSPVNLFLFIDGGSVPSMPMLSCSAGGTGDEVCGWDLRIIATGDVTLDGFTPDGDVIFNLTDGKTFIANGGNPIDPPAAPQRIGVLTVSATAPGTVEVQGGISVTSMRQRENIPTLLIGETGIEDADGDSVADNMDNCINFANADQRDTDGDGIGNACDADLSNNCVVSFEDLGLLKLVFFSNDPTADFNGNGSVSFDDLGFMKQVFFTAPGPSGVPNICDGS